MKPWIAILFTIGLVAACFGLSSFVGFNLIWIMVPATCLWTAIDSSKIQLRKYQSGISGGPMVIFIGCAFLWIVVFPWYLAVRHKIKTGTASLREQYV